MRRATDSGATDSGAARRVAARRVAAGFLVAAIVAAMVIGALWTLQRRLIYFPDRASPGPAAAVLPGAHDVTLTTSDGLQLSAWLVPPHHDPRHRDIAVLVAPGNGGNRADRAPLAEALAAEGLTTLLMDYRGYGGNPGTPTETGLARDVRAAWKHLTASYPPQRVILFGESLGAAVVAGLAAELSGAGGPTPGGLVLRSPFTSLADVGRAHYPWLPVRALLRDRYEVQQAVSALNVPVAVVYGAADSIVPPRQSVAVAAAAERAQRPGQDANAGRHVHTAVVPGADHNDAALAFGPQVIATVLTVADQLPAA